MSVRKPAVVTTTVRGFPLSLQAAPDYTAAHFVYIVSCSLLANCSVAQCHIVTTTERIVKQTYLLTCSVEQKPSWEASRFSASQKCSLILWKEKVHYRVQNSSPPVPVLNQTDPVHAPIPLLEDSYYYYPPIYVSVFQVVSYPQVSPPKLCMHFFSPPYMLHITCLAQLSILELITQIIFGEEYRA
jgi:hypothetical protein